MGRYARSVPLSEEERARLPAVMIARPLTLDLKSVAHEGMTPREAVTRCRAHRARVEAIAGALSHSLQPGQRGSTTIRGTNKEAASPGAGQLLTETFPFDGGRQVTAYVPPAPPEAIVYAGDGQLIAPWGDVLESADLPPTMIIGVHRLDDEVLRVREYSPGEGGWYHLRHRAVRGTREVLRRRRPPMGAVLADTFLDHVGVTVRDRRLR